MRVLICGDRNWTDYRAIRELVRSLPVGSTVIEGDARGADRMAGQAAREFGVAVEVYPAQWDTHGRAAGPIRNQQMLDEGKPDAVCWFHDKLSESKGTRDMVQRAQRAGIPTYGNGVKP